MTAKIKQIPTYIKMTAAIMSPLILTVIGFYIYGMQIHNEEKIYPNITIAGIDVSGLTRPEAAQALGLAAYEERSANAIVSLVFPDDSELKITGNDAKLKHNAHDMINEAYYIGRGRGVILDAVSYLRRLEADTISFDIVFLLDEDVLKKIVTTFTDVYNKKLDASEPMIYDDRIVFTKGVGHVNADAAEIFELAYNGIYQSLEDGIPVDIIYTLPETTEFIPEILEIRDNIFVQMLSSGYDRETDSATVSAVGVSFDPIEAARLVGGLESGRSTTFYLEFTEPDYSQEHFASLLFRDSFGERTTHAHGSSNRLNNIELASEAINGLVLLPGEEFSFNGVVGARTAERGYKYAPALSQGETIMSIGGGVCQVSSTIYAAIRPSELNVTDQRKHGKPVPYLPWGWDATVFYPYIDFKFVNNTDYPLRIEIELVERSLTARVFGTIVDDFPIAAN